MNTPPITSWTQPEVIPDQTAYLKCAVCDALPGQPCERITGVHLNEETGEYIPYAVYADQPHSSRKKSTRTPGKPRAPRQPALPPEPVDPLAPKAAPKSKAVVRRRARSQQTMVDSWAALAQRQKDKA